MRLRAVLLTAALLTTPGCLVVSLHPAYDEDALAWDPALVGVWQSLDDETSIEIEQDEWRSYRIRYKHPIEAGELTGYLTEIGEARYLDVMPARGTDRGAFVVPVHAVARIRLADNRLEVTPLSYDWFLDRARKGTNITGLAVSLDQKQNALLTSTTPVLQRWLKAQGAGGPAFGATTTFLKK